MKFIGTGMYNGDFKDTFPIVIECIGLEIRKMDGSIYEIDLNNCRINLHCANDVDLYYITRAEKSILKEYYGQACKGLNKCDVETIMKCAVESDVIDLRNLGDYLIHIEHRTRLTSVENDLDDETGDYIPLYVKIVEN